MLLPSLVLPWKSALNLQCGMALIWGTFRWLLRMPVVLATAMRQHVQSPASNSRAMLCLRMLRRSALNSGAYSRSKRLLGHDRTRMSLAPDLIRLTESGGEIDEVAPIPIRLTTSHFDTRSRGCHIAAIGGGSVKSPVCHKQRRVPRLYDSARSELERGLHSNILSERFTNCANASRRPATRHQESIRCVQGNKRVKVARV